MGYAWAGVCYPDTATALSAFAKDIPSVDGFAIMYFASAPTINSSGLISWTINHRPLDTGNTTARAGTTQLLTCSVPTLDQWPIQDLFVPIALFFSAVFGFRTGFVS